MCVFKIVLVHVLFGTLKQLKPISGCVDTVLLVGSSGSFNIETTNNVKLIEFRIIGDLCELLD